MRRGFVLLALLPLTLRAQQIAGVVSRNGLPVEGAVVLLLDANGREVGRTASHEGGSYRLSAAPGRYRLQVMQIGWRPAIVGPVELRTGVTTTSNLALQSAPVALLGVNIVGRQKCAVRPDSSGKAFAVWEAARAALLATSLTGVEPFDVSIVRNERTLVDDGARVVEDTTETTHGKTVSPFRSLSPRVLADSGYVTMTADRGRMFWAPDADVLLSEEFLSHHCFELNETPGDPRIALRFTPTSTRNGVVDVEGVLRVDRKTGELRDLEYRYVNGSDVLKKAEAGGEVQFLRSPRGRWVVSHWVIRYPLMGTRRMYTGAIVPGQRAETRSHDEMEGLKLTTVTLLDISRNGVKLWERGRVSVAVRVLDSTTNEPRSGVLVGFAGSGEAMATDSSGFVRLDLVDPGSPVLRLDDPSLRALGVRQQLRVVDVPDFNDAVITVKLPSARAMFVSQCGTHALNWGEGVLSGQVRQMSDSASVVVVSSTPFVRLGHATPLVVEKYMEIQPAQDGSFRVCGIPRDASLRVRKSDEPAGSGRTVRFDPGALGVSVSLP